MSESRGGAKAPGLTIRHVAERSGVAPGTLRAWETRYGFPEPTRLPSGHRRYSDRDVDLVKQVIRDRDSGLALPVAIDRARRAPARPDTSIFAELRRRRPDLIPHLLPKRTLVGLSHAIEDECSAHAERALLFASFQRERYFRDAEARWREMARTAELAVVMADFESRRDPPEGPIELPLDRSDSMVREWSLVCDAPNYRACLTGWERPGQGSVREGKRLFETIWTVEPSVVREAARLSGELVGRTATDLEERISERLKETPPPSDDAFRLVMELTSRMIAYVGAPAVNRRPGPPPRSPG